MEQAEIIGACLMDESMYEYLQSLMDIDLKTSCWLNTSIQVREKGSALFGDKRYDDRCFIYHNGADSYYGVRSFRSVIKLALYT